MTISSVRLAPSNNQVLEDLGLLSELVGTWEGRGFNLIARPDHVDRANLFLQLSQTHEALRVSPIGSGIPNRGFGQDDINMFGADYLQKIHDHATGGALHFEPGLWVYQPATNPPLTFPPEDLSPAQLVHRMGSIPHGNAVLASGTAQPFTGPPALPSGTAPYNGSLFPSFNSTPFGAGGALSAAGSSEADTAAALGVPPFQQYNVTGDPIDGVKLQDAVNDPILLLQAAVQPEADRGSEFEGTVINIATRTQISFNTQKNTGGPAAPTAPATVPGADGGVENIEFLDGGSLDGGRAANAHTALVYATFWITTVHPKDRAPYQQLQYAQLVELDFPIFTVAFPASGQGAIANLGWPHISVATLRKSFNS